MTQKQTNYDKALKECKDTIKVFCECHFMSNDEILNNAFREGYRFGIWQQMEKQKAEQTENREKSQNVANCDIDHFRDSTKMMRYEIAKAAMQGILSTNLCGLNPDVIAESAVGYADALNNELEKEEEL